ncbi:hypothetical protein QBC39DRAFT_334078 [Podospora conica]|nr:hypothetical protein QBC39DRAFT_334078 [Schizothecium conicum]
MACPFLVALAGVLLERVGGFGWVIRAVRRRRKPLPGIHVMSRAKVPMVRRREVDSACQGAPRTKMTKTPLTVVTHNNLSWVRQSDHENLRGQAKAVSTPLTPG